MSTVTTSAGRLEPAIAARPATSRLGHVLAFAGLSVGLAAAATLGGVPPALVPFVLALGPTVLALAFTWREGGGGAVRRLLGTAATRPNRRVWYALFALPIAWALSVVAVAVAFGEPSGGVFDKVFPAIVVLPLVVLIPAFAEEIAWRGYAVNRLLPSMTPLTAALLLGIPWAAMHLFLQLPGQMNAGLDWWPTIVSLIGYSVILTWAFVGSGGSVLLVAFDPRRAQRRRAADGRCRHRPRLDHSGAPCRGDRSRDRRRGPLPTPRRAGPAGPRIWLSMGHPSQPTTSTNSSSHKESRHECLYRPAGPARPPNRVGALTSRLIGIASAILVALSSPSPSRSRPTPPPMASGSSSRAGRTPHSRPIRPSSCSSSTTARPGSKATLRRSWWSTGSRTLSAPAPIGSSRSRAGSWSMLHHSSRATSTRSTHASPGDRNHGHGGRPRPRA